MQRAVESELEDEQLDDIRSLTALLDYPRSLYTHPRRCEGKGGELFLNWSPVTTHSAYTSERLMLWSHVVMSRKGYLCLPERVEELREHALTVQ